jgi:DNA helicase-2/ATP-dependent DNA helicase PcrA
MPRDYILQPFRPPIDLHIDYARELNEQQHAAVTAPPGPALVIAGAGSGKTRTLIYRVAYLLEQGIPANRILLLTFTNKAAREMMRRVADLLGQELRELWGGTFHAIGNRILRSHAEKLGYQRDFSILDREDAKHLITACVAEAGIDTKGSHFPKAEVLGEIFSLAENTQKKLSDILTEQYGDLDRFAGLIADVQNRYANRKRASNAMDFDDLLVLWLKLLQDDADVREQYQRRFQFILVDEYQDTNKLQGDLIDLLAARHKNVMVVGDDAQSIYAWRGANYLNILQFPHRYPGSTIYKIETNYRSTPEILKLANVVISENVEQFTKELVPARKSGAKPVLVACNDSSEQAAMVAQRALELRDEGTSLSNMAVLYRSHFHALELQLELTKRSIPFSITSGIRFFEQAHIKDVTAYLKLILNPHDELSFKRLVQLLPGIGGKGADKLWRSFESAEQGRMSQDLSDDLAARSANQLPTIPPPPTREGLGEGPVPSGSRTSLARKLQSLAPSIPKKAAITWAQFVATVSQLEAEDIRNNPSKMISLVIEAGYEDYLIENYDNHESRLDDLEQLAVFGRQFPGAEEFLTQLALLSNIEAEDDKPAKADEERMRLSTVHQAKGLEFDVVFVIMLCDGLFPSKRSVETPAGEEEERRLMYVAITRARNELYLSYPIMRAAAGGEGDYMQLPSRFIANIPPDLIEEWNLRPYRGGQSSWDHELDE